MGDIVMFRTKKSWLCETLSEIERDFEDHLDAINENTSEILENRTMILELHERICKLSDQINSLRLIINESIPSHHKIELELREQELFLLLYCEDKGLSYGDISRRLSVPISGVRELTYSLIQKGIPIIKKRRDSTIWCSLDIEFCEDHSKYNIVNIDEAVQDKIKRLQQKSLL